MKYIHGATKLIFENLKKIEIDILSPKFWSSTKFWKIFKICKKRKLCFGGGVLIGMCTKFQVDTFNTDVLIAFETFKIATFHDIPMYLSSN